MTTGRTLKVGMIGAGFIGQLGHLMNLVEVKACQVVAVAEMRPNLRRRVAERYAIPRAYGTHTELLGDPEVEAVVVVTPRPYTGPVVLDCLQAGKHVLCEKPMAGTVEQAQRLVETARAQGVHYVVGYMKRHDEGVQAAKRMLDELRASQELGPIIFTRAHCFMGDSYCKADGHVVTDEKASYADSGWPIAPPDFDEGLARRYAYYLNTYSHNTNLLRYMFDGFPSVESVHFANPRAQVAVLGFGDFVASLETGQSSNRGWDEVLEVYFADGLLTLKTPPGLLKNVPARVELYKEGTIQQTVIPHCNWTWAFRRQAEAFVAGVLADSTHLSSADDALQDVRLIDAMWRKEKGA